MKGGNYMATSTFAKQFAVKPEKVTEFVNEMTRTVTPTLKRDFHSKLTHEKELRNDLMKALNK